ncbi:unnamed protein product [Protopolystoma xenopodis]|uniref:Uncharacterized protein n=1 Tax=Protopolystoma xenopodis TaxID=117903 RepID=A0A3S4ZAR8_9PLAT|nr:unnamed protein product [Protopolystoma xenopodis]
MTRSFCLPVRQAIIGLHILCLRQGRAHNGKHWPLRFTYSATLWVYFFISSEFIKLVSLCCQASGRAAFLIDCILPTRSFYLPLPNCYAMFWASDWLPPLSRAPSIIALIYAEKNAAHKGIRISLQLSLKSESSLDSDLGSDADCCCCCPCCC